LYIFQRERWTFYKLGLASIKNCEVALMDFRLFPRLEKMEVNYGHIVVLEQLRKVFENTMLRGVYTWMLIFS